MANQHVKTDQISLGLIFHISSRAKKPENVKKLQVLLGNAK